jgi:folate-dependent tRNA-U54 methylase TrmFO/GidA
MNTLNIIGAGLAGSEAAWQAAEREAKVNLYEMRNEHIKTAAHLPQLLLNLFVQTRLEMMRLPVQSDYSMRNYEDVNHLF